MEIKKYINEFSNLAIKNLTTDVEKYKIRNSCVEGMYAIVDKIYENGKQEDFFEELFKSEDIRVLIETANFSGKGIYNYNIKRSIEVLKNIISNDDFFNNAISTHEKNACIKMVEWMENRLIKLNEIGDDFLFRQFYRYVASANNYIIYRSDKKKLSDDGWNNAIKIVEEVISKNQANIFFNNAFTYDNDARVRFVTAMISVEMNYDLQRSKETYQDLIDKQLVGPRLIQLCKEYISKI